MTIVRDVLPLIALLLAATAHADVPAGEAQAIVTGQLKDILPAGRTVRDYAPFETERGEGALLVLAVTGAVDAAEAPYPDEPTCPDMVEGVPLTGVYSVALVVRGALVNEVGIPDDGPDSVPRPITLPLRNRADYNARWWGQPVTGDPHAIEPTRLVRLADYDGDGNAFEFRLVKADGCGHALTLLAGYSPRRRQAALFPVFEDERARFWPADVFPGVDGAGTGRITRRWVCDHGADERLWTKLRFDPRREAWKVVGMRRAPCPRDP